MDEAMAKEHNPFVLAAFAFVLALTSPAIIALSAKVGATAGTATAIASPLIALSILFAFAFHIRFALGAMRAEKRPASILATLAMVVGVTGFIGSILLLMGILR
jgi:hypothetical protein